MRMMLTEQQPLFLEVDVSGVLPILVVKKAWSEFSISQEFEQLIAHSGDSPLKFCIDHRLELESQIMHKP